MIGRLANLAPLHCEANNEFKSFSSLNAVSGGLNQLDEALRNFKAALEVRKKLGLEVGIASSLNMIARTEARMGDYENALGHFKEFLARFRAQSAIRATLRPC